MNNIGFYRADILLPKQVDMEKWSTVACDQYTSEPDYWNRVEKFANNAPSTLYMVFPEINLEENNPEKRIADINNTMQEYYNKGIFENFEESMIYVERIQRDGLVRHGLIGMVDLEQYDYNKGSQSLIRATEGTVLERIPPRVKVRKDALLELPHIMLLIDDPCGTVIEPLKNKAESFKKAYDFDLMENSGSISGWVLSESAMAEVEDALSQLISDDVYTVRYGNIGQGKLLFAVGDGNHSLATAKECYRQLKESVPEEEWINSPARYALVEVVNVHDTSLVFEPIHRVLFGVNAEHLMEELAKTYDLSFEECEGQSFEYVSPKKRGKVWIKNPTSNLAVGTLQSFLDYYLKKYGGKIDYIHGDEVVEKLGAKEGNIGFLLPSMDKADLFKTVLIDGTLPRKTFSMGHAWDKRFYLECRKIK